MPKKEIINVEMKGGNPNLSPGARFGDLVFVAGQTGTHPDTGKLGEGVAEQTRFTIERIKRVLEAAGTNFGERIVGELLAYEEGGPCRVQ